MFHQSTYNFGSNIDYFLSATYMHITICDIYLFCQYSRVLITLDDIDIDKKYYKSIFIIGTVCVSKFFDLF